MFVEKMTLCDIDANIVFSKQEYFNILQRNGYTKVYSSFLVAFQKLIDNQFVYRVGRNKYKKAQNNMFLYDYDYSPLSKEISKLIQSKHPYLYFTVFEMNQLNEFMNHQIGKNTIFVFVEKDGIDFVFNTLKDNHYQNVLLKPTKSVFHTYRGENTIVLIRLVSEFPKIKGCFWKESIEKLLVDIVAEPLIHELIAEEEYMLIYNEITSKFIIDLDKLYRYARRRNAVNKIEYYI